MELLEEAGFKDVNGDGFVENPDGSEINFDIHVVNGWTDWVQTVQMVSEFLAEVGIKANTKTVDWSVYDNALKEGTYQASINWSRTNGEDPIQAYRDYFYTAQQGLSWHTNHGISSEKVDNLIDEYSATVDESRRKAILAELMKLRPKICRSFRSFQSTWYQYNATRIGG